MANEEQLAILRQGAKIWDEWREKNYNTKIDLSGADLSRNGYLSDAWLDDADLSGADFSDVEIVHGQFNNANLSHAQFSGAVLINTGFRDADLRGINLRGADLSGTNLDGADLRGADLSGARLFRTNFNSADVSGADLSGAILSATLFNYVDLSQVKGLETVRHDSPSSISIDTIYYSIGNIPEVFLRGCGVPENFITFMHSLTGNAFDFYSCFISYSSKDEEFAKRLHADLQSNGIRVWFAPEDLKIGAWIQESIEDAIRVYDKLLIVLSCNSIESAWVEHEIKTALKKEDDQKRTVLFPVRLDDAVMDTTQQWAYNVKRNRNIGDFSKWRNHDDYQKSFERLVRDLQADSVKQ